MYICTYVCMYTYKQIRVQKTHFSKGTYSMTYVKSPHIQHQWTNICRHIKTHFSTGTSLMTSLMTSRIWISICGLGASTCECVCICVILNHHSLTFLHTRGGENRSWSGAWEPQHVNQHVCVILNHRTFKINIHAYMEKSKSQPGAWEPQHVNQRVWVVLNHHTLAFVHTWRKCLGSINMLIGVH